MPTVSIIMPTFCRGDNGLLRRAIDSVLAQSFRDFELIIIDDGSKDQTRNVIASYGDSRIRYIRHEINSGLPAKRVNEGIRLARGQYIAFQFDDDLWYPNHLAVTVHTLGRLSEEYGMVFTFSESINTQTNEVFILGSDYSPQLMIQKNCIGNQSVLIRKSTLLTVGGFDEDPMMKRSCDWELWLRVIAVGYKIYPIAQITTVNYYLLPNSLRVTEGIDMNYIRRKMLQNQRTYLRNLVMPLNYEALTRPDVLNKGCLLKTANNPGIYFVVFGYKHLISSEQKFEELGFDWGKVKVVSEEYLRQFTDGIPLK